MINSSLSLELERCSESAAAGGAPSERVCLVVHAIMAPQVGIRQEIQDEDGAVMSMVVGERRQFVVGPEIFFKRKLFGNLVPQNEECLLVDVELLSLQPY